MTNCKNCWHEIWMWAGHWYHNPITESKDKPCMKGPNCGCKKPIPEIQDNATYTESHKGGNDKK